LTCAFTSGKHLVCMASLFSCFDYHLPWLLCVPACVNWQHQCKIPCHGCYVTQKFLGTCPGSLCEVYNQICRCWQLCDVLVSTALFTGLRKLVSYQVQISFWQCGINFWVVQCN
jgi:hypothetical protein